MMPDLAQILAWVDEGERLPSRIDEREKKSEW